MLKKSALGRSGQPSRNNDSNDAFELNHCCVVTLKSVEYCSSFSLSDFFNTIAPIADIVPNGQSRPRKPKSLRRSYDSNRSIPGRLPAGTRGAIGAYFVLQLYIDQVTRKSADDIVATHMPLIDVSGDGTARKTAIRSQE
jgi:hypothetical protein